MRGDFLLSDIIRKRVILDESHKIIRPANCSKQRSGPCTEAESAFCIYEAAP